MTTDRVLPGQTSRAQWIGSVWAALAVAILSGWFVMTCLSVTSELQIWDRPLSCSLPPYCSEGKDRR